MSLRRIVIEMPKHGGLWRYELWTRRVEVLTVGMTNPWGHDWTAEGECFFVNTINGHLWHLVPGAHLRQRHGHDPNPHCYETIDHHADHFHFDTGAGWQQSRDGAASDLGGGHAHAGCMIYAGTNWPAEYRGRLFTLNFHGRRVNQEILERAGSGYVARHGRDRSPEGAVRKRRCAHVGQALGVGLGPSSAGPDRAVAGQLPHGGRSSRLCEHPDEHVRTWAIRLLTDGWPIDTPLGPVPFDAARTVVVADESAALIDRFS